MNFFELPRHMHTLAEPLVIVQPTPDPLTDAFYERLLAFYAAQPDDSPHKGEVWNGVTKHQASLVSSLQSESVPALRYELEHIYVGLRVIGLDWAEGLLVHPDLQEKGVAHWTHMLFTAAHSLGVLPVFNPEQPTPGIYYAEDLVSRMEAALGCRISHSGGGRMPGAVVGDRFIPLKLLLAVTHLATLPRLGIVSHADPIKSILEIGGGTGFTAGLLARYSPWLVYHLIDLPVVAVMQAFLLACDHGELNVWLNGEPYQCERLCIHGLQTPDKFYNLVLNQDSLPEMPPDVMRDYLDYAVCQLEPGGMFHSINQESGRSGQGCVHTAMQRYRNMTLKQRSPSWARVGYVEEVWVKR